MSSPKSCCTQFWLRKLHSLSGIVFLGYFLLYHMQGELPFESDLVKVIFFYGPLLFHGIYGLFIVFEMKTNLGMYPTVRNGMFVAQRISALIILPFILLHVSAMRYSMPYDDATWYIALWYVGVVAAVFHLANGIFGSAIHWGIAIGNKSQKVLVGLGFTSFAILAAWGLNTLYNF